MDGRSSFEIYTLTGMPRHELLVDLGLVPKEGEYICPKCGTKPLSLTCDRERGDGFRWVCYARIQRGHRKAKMCHTRIGYRRGTFFERSLLSINKILGFVLFWVGNTTLDDISRHLAISEKTSRVWASFCREVVLCSLYDNRQILGGPDVVVEIDESKFGRRKYHRGKRVEGQWVVGGYERGTGRVFMVPVEERNTSTLVSLIKEWVRPGSIIMSDCWKAKEGLSHEGCEHLKANHSVTFVGPDVGARRSLAAETWRAGRSAVAYPGQRRKLHVPGNLARHMLRKRCRDLKLDQAREFFRLAGALYNPCNPTTSDLPRPPLETDTSSTEEGNPSSAAGADGASDHNYAKVIEYDDEDIDLFNGQ